VKKDCTVNGSNENQRNIDPERKPDLVLKGGRVFLLNPEALPIALRNTALVAYKMYCNGQWKPREQTQKQEESSIKEEIKRNKAEKAKERN